MSVPARLCWDGHLHPVGGGLHPDGGFRTGGVFVILAEAGIHKGGAMKRLWLGVLGVVVT